MIRLAGELVLGGLASFGVWGLVTAGVDTLEQRHDRKVYDSAVAREQRIAALEVELGVENPVYAHAPDSAVVEVPAMPTHEQTLEQYEAVIATFQRRAAVCRAAIKNRPHERDRYRKHL